MLLHVYSQLFLSLADIIGKKETVKEVVHMNETRKKIIIHEIKYWKQTNLLPEKYCDYLLTLYSGGEEEIAPANKKSNISLHIPLWIFTVIFFTILFINYFTEIPKGLQITLTAIAIIIFGFFIVRYLENGLLFHLALVCLALLVLIESVNIANLLFPSKQWIIIFSTTITMCDLVCS